MKELKRFDLTYTGDFDTFYIDPDGNLCEVIRDGMIGKKLRVGDVTYGFFSAQIDDDMNLHNLSCCFPRRKIKTLKHIKYSDEQRFLINAGVLSHLKEIKNLKEVYNDLESSYNERLCEIKGLEERAINSIEQKKDSVK